MKYFFTLLILFFFLSATNSFAQWEYWEASQFPDTTGTPWSYSFEDGITEIRFSSIIDDPDIAENKLLQFDEPTGTPKEVFRYAWNADASTGSTLIFRMKALSVGTYNRDWDIYLQNGAVRERLISNNGEEVKFDKSKAAIAFDTSDWHIYRLTMIEDQIELFIDEDPLSYISTTGETNMDIYFQFGDNGSSSIGTLYDWIAWDVSGPYPPGEGDPLPEVLTGVTSIEKISSIIPEKLKLLQNYPNPFNPTTEVRFKLPARGKVELNIYDMTGRLVRNLFNETKTAGEYSIVWDGRNLDGNLVPSGTYIYKIKTEDGVASRKMTLLK